MDEDGEDKDDSKRRTRNLSEKKRRDQFNMLVHELGTMILSNNRKMDKSSILKSTISFLRSHNELTARSKAHDVQEDWKPSFLSNEEFTYLVLEALEGFMMVFSGNGRIFYVSESILSLLGHNSLDLMQKSIFDIAYEDDHPKLYRLLQNPEAAIQLSQGGDTENPISFKCYLRRGNLEVPDEVTYEQVHFIGHFRTDIDLNDGCDESYPQDHDSRLVFICTGKLCTPQLIRDVSLVDAKCNEFTSRHSLEWKYLFLDHRGPPIIGYLPFEVLGTSGYDYYHFDDLEKVVSCHEALMQKGELTSCFYRFLTKGQQWIWLQTRFYITYHQWNSKPEFVVCTHRVISFTDKDNKKPDNAEPEARGESEPKRNRLKVPSPNDSMSAVSPSYMSETSDAFGNSYHSVSQPPSVKSAATSASSTTATGSTIGTANNSANNWPNRPSHIRYVGGSDTASASGESRSSQRNSLHEQPHHQQEPALVPQHVIGAEYLEPAPYVGAVGIPRVLPIPLQTLPVIVTPNQTQMQEQLQRTHRELQQMIVRQQEELRQVKEQLLLARLGILQPVINVQDPYGHTEEIQPAARIPAQILYDGSHVRPVGGYPPSHQLHPPPQGHHPHPPPQGHHPHPPPQGHHSHPPPQVHHPHPPPQGHHPHQNQNQHHMPPQ